MKQVNLRGRGSTSTGLGCQALPRYTREMRIFFLAVLLAVPAAWAADEVPGTYAYWTAGAGGLTAAGHTNLRVDLNGGGEIGIAHGIAAGGEVGFIAPIQHFADGLIGQVSANGYYHPLRRKIDPFATLGYTVLFRSDTKNALNYGGGLNYWFSRSIAMRGEFRDHTYEAGSVRAHFWSFRLGVSFTRFSP